MRDTDYSDLDTMSWDDVIADAAITEAFTIAWS